MPTQQPVPDERSESRLEGATAARDLEPFEVLIDLVDIYDDRGYLRRTEKVTRTVSHSGIPKGARIRLGAGRWLHAD